MLDILLLIPSDIEVFGKINVKKIDTDQFTLGVAYIASYVREKGYSVDILNLRSLGNDWRQKLKDKIISEKPHYVGISCVTPLIRACRTTASYVKSIDKDIKIIVGGPHPTVLPDETAKLDEFDVVVIGEGEFTVYEILRNDDLNKVKGIIYKEGDKLIKTEPREVNMNLDQLPWPAYDLMQNLDKYANPFLGRSANILTGRGCPFKCIFCPSNLIGGGIYRLRSTSDVVDEIEFLYKKYKIKGFLIMDETFTLYPKRVIEICNGIIERKMKIKWTCDTRVNTVTEDLLRKMKEAGFRLIKFGIESGDDEILRIIKKGTTTDMVRKAVGLAKKVGLGVHAFFIIGHPYDTKETILRTINFAKELPLDFAQFSIMVPFPGTEIYSMAKQGRGITLLSDNWNDFKKYGKPVIELPTVSREELEKFHAMAYRQFYFRPSYIIKRFFKTKPAEYLNLFNKALALLNFIKQS